MKIFYSTDSVGGLFPLKLQIKEKGHRKSVSFFERNWGLYVGWYLLHYAHIQPPPSALMVWPESQWLSSEARNTTIGATSS